MGMASNHLGITNGLEQPINCHVRKSPRNSISNDPCFWDFFDDRCSHLGTFWAEAYHFSLLYRTYTKATVLTAAYAG